jgi:FKBP-type peptidyl-prolyl cis-trans isomerase SlyD
MKPQVISSHYTLKGKDGKTIESSYEQDPVVYLEESGMIIPGLEKEITSLKQGDKKQIHVKATEAYGEHDAALIVSVPLDQLPKDRGQIKVGDQFSSRAPDGREQVFTVTNLGKDAVSMDGNHPLAGQDLTFDVEILDKREATEEELSHGHAHGPGGHHSH